MSPHKRYARVPGKFDWIITEPELIDYAIIIGTLWLQREQKEKGRVTGDILVKACGILAEEIFEGILDEFEIPHSRTLPLLPREHPVNQGRPYDSMIDGKSIDVKCCIPIPIQEGWNCSTALNLKKSELDAIGRSDIYLAAKAQPEQKYERHDKFDPESIQIATAVRILAKIKEIDFLGWCYDEELVKEENLHKSGFAPYYQLYPHDPKSDRPALHEMSEFAALFKIPIKSLMGTRSRA